MKFFTADQHFNHRNIIEYCNRPFKNVGEMNEALITNWNAKVRDNDHVFVLGDMVWEGNAREILDRLKGKIIYIPSKEWTHEKCVLEHKDRFMRVVEPITVLDAKREHGVSIVLCHYCMRTFPKSHYNHWHLFGHSHGRLEPIGKSWDVGVDNNNFYPLSLDEVATIMAKRPDNPGYTKTRGFYRTKVEEA